MIPTPDPADFSRWKSINVHSKVELAYWSRQFECSEAELVEVMSRTGSMVLDVRAALAEIAKRIRTPPT